MKTYEFYAKPVNGIIEIPEDYREDIVDNVKVIIIGTETEQKDRQEASKRRKTASLTPPTLKTKGWKFNREEANER
ncbi:MAG: hypothetical protein LBS19_06660 [Clostridiales bacterium]|jgi:hypothetical protein|nr:hypothetical protein [Clostridiales bacterium]